MRLKKASIGSGRSRGRFNLAVLSASFVVGGFSLFGLATPISSSPRATVTFPVNAVWQYQLQTGPGTEFAATGGIDVGLCAKPVLGGACQRARVFSIDLYGPNGTSANVAGVRAIRQSGGRAICYVDAGTWESWRPDAGAFSRSLLGRSNGWPGERWLDIRKMSLILPIMARRVALCERAGFQAVDFDNVDAFTNVTGFPLTANEQIHYDEALATLAHRDHMAVGLKNDSGQSKVLEPWFDFAIDEQCIQDHFCATLAPFVRAGKPVYDVEYVGNPLTTCKAAPAGINVIMKALSLQATPWRPCR